MINDSVTTKGEAQETVLRDADKVIDDSAATKRDPGFVSQVERRKTGSLLTP